MIRRLVTAITSRLTRQTDLDLRIRAADIGGPSPELQAAINRRRAIRDQLAEDCARDCDG